MSHVSHQVVLFDGFCHLCTSTVQFITRHDRRSRFKFTPIQSKLGRQLYQDHGLDPDQIKTFLLISKTGVYSKSDAAIQIAKGLGGIWHFTAIFMVVPKPIRDAIYSLIAKNRMRWFGSRNLCWTPLEETKAHDSR